MTITRTIKKQPGSLVEFIKTSIFALLIAVFCTACGQDAGAEQRPGEVRSILEGEITLSAEVDSIPDFSGFEILVGERTADGMDTLAFSTTDQAGKFAMEVNAPRTNIYSLIIARAGSILRVDEIAIADGDSASFKVQFPFGRRPIMIRSIENAALMGFKNTVALHNNEIDNFSREGVEDRSVYANKIFQTAEILWGLQASSEGTLASDLAAAQSIVMLENWNDSLVVERAKALSPDNVNYGNVVGAARRSQVRIAGAEEGPVLLKLLKEKVTDEDIKAVVQSELVLAYRDNENDEEALAAARELKMQYATDSSWIRWADRAIFDLEKLRPGMDAPAFSLTDKEGQSVSLESFAGKYVVLEFYAPSPEFVPDMIPRNAFYRAEGASNQFEILSISLQSDAELNEAFFDGRDFPGRHVFLENGASAKVVKDYNIYLLPTRFLVDPAGKLVGKYVLANGINAFQEALALSSAQSTDG